MLYVYIEPSAWLKRYIVEVGRDVTNHLFAQLLRPQRQLYSSWAGYTEILSALNRRRNAGQISQSVFNVEQVNLETDCRAIRLMSVRNYSIRASGRLILAHNLNATDALHLQTALEIHSRLQPQGDRLLFFSADQRLLRAAQTEGLTIFNPETGTITHLDNLLTV